MLAVQGARGPERLLCGALPIPGANCRSKGSVCNGHRSNEQHSAARCERRQPPCCPLQVGAPTHSISHRTPLGVNYRRAVVL